MITPITVRTGRGIDLWLCTCLHRRLPWGGIVEPSISKVSHCQIRTRTIQCCQTVAVFLQIPGNIILLFQCAVLWHRSMVEFSRSHINRYWDTAVEGSAGAERLGISFKRSKWVRLLDYRGSIWIIMTGFWDIDVRNFIYRGARGVIRLKKKIK